MQGEVKDEVEVKCGELTLRLKLRGLVYEIEVKN